MTEIYQQHVEEVMPLHSKKTLNEIDTALFGKLLSMLVGVATLCLIGSSGKMYSTKYISGIKPIEISTTHLAAYSYVTKKLGDACSAQADCFTEFCEPLAKVAIAQCILCIERRQTLEIRAAIGKTLKWHHIIPSQILTAIVDFAATACAQTLRIRPYQLVCSETPMLL